MRVNMGAFAAPNNLNEGFGFNPNQGSNQVNSANQGGNIVVPPVPGNQGNYANMPILPPSGNRALFVNPPVGANFILSIPGSSWLWAVFAFMAFSAIVIAALSMRLRYRERTLHLFNIAILSTAAIAYFCMASDLGFTPVRVTQHGYPLRRQIWYVRYVEWAITTPLLLTQLLLTAGLPSNIILSTVFADLVMVVCGLIGALVPSTYKWAFFVFAIVAMFWVFWNVASGVKAAIRLGGEDYQRKYLILGFYLIFIWILYPICWGLSEGSNTITVTGEMVFYGILDIFAKPVFAALVLILHRTTDLAKLGLASEGRLERIEQEKVGYQEPKQVVTERTVLTAAKPPSPTRNGVNTHPFLTGSQTHTSEDIRHS